MPNYIQPSFEILTKINREAVLLAIEEAGRICYQSKHRIRPGSASQFVGMIVGRQHLSVIEHFAVSVRFIVNRGFTHELVRHRLASYSQESTRYCNYSKGKYDADKKESAKLNIIDQRPVIAESFGLKLGEWESSKDEEHRSWEPVSKATCAILKWEKAMEDAEKSYMALIDCGATPQIARGCLPIDVKTEIVITANLREWMHIFEMRCSPAAHPNMRQLMIPLREEFRQVLPEIFGEPDENGVSPIEPPDG